MKKVDKERVMDLIEKAGDAENYETAWDEKGNCNFKKKTNIKRGRISRARGARFELKVRKDLEEKGRVVDKWSNNIEFESEEDFEKGKIIPAKRKFNPFSKVMTIGTGFPDFISIKQISEGIYSVIGVEVKMNGILSKIEKEKCRWYLKHVTFSEIWVAKQKQVGRRIEVEYVDFKERYGM
ncbi:hypothetical protein HN832_02785 [archaeon]|jgi:hypothetical protein|nr:hypothetical protein [archaeon]MBT4373281.1 hypothetical protein [archaeon]MBT4531626.1 hypothetical protein [archaeon]MBT7001196.1 hypothetical protein [archaeon]MBT7282318.1 hypothetical protein [archaeon]